MGGASVNLVQSISLLNNLYVGKSLVVNGTQVWLYSHSLRGEGSLRQIWNLDKGLTYKFDIHYLFGNNPRAGKVNLVQICLLRCWVWPLYRTVNLIAIYEATVLGYMQCDRTQPLRSILIWFTEFVYPLLIT